MSKYWPVVFWCYEVEDGVLKYKPSIAHADRLRWCFTENDALFYGLHGIKDGGQSAMPTFIVKVIESKTRPDVTISSTLRLLVTRIPLDNDREVN